MAIITNSSLPISVSFLALPRNFLSSYPTLEGAFGYSKQVFPISVRVFVRWFAPFDKLFCSSSSRMGSEHSPFCVPNNTISGDHSYFFDRQNPPTSNNRFEDPSGLCNKPRLFHPEYQWQQPREVKMCPPYQQDLLSSSSHHDWPNGTNVRDWRYWADNLIVGGGGSSDHGSSDRPTISSNNRYDIFNRPVQIDQTHNFSETRMSIFDQRFIPNCPTNPFSETQTTRELIPFTVRPRPWTPGNHSPVCNPPQNTTPINGDVPNTDQINGEIGRDAATEIRACTTRVPTPSTMRLEGFSNTRLGIFTPDSQTSNYSSMNSPNTPSAPIPPARSSNSLTPAPLTPPSHHRVVENGENQKTSDVMSHDWSNPSSINGSNQSTSNLQNIMRS